MIQHLKKKIAWLIFIFIQLLVICILVLINYSSYFNELSSLKQDYKSLLFEMEPEELFAPDSIEASFHLSEYAVVMVPKEDIFPAEPLSYINHFSSLDTQTLLSTAKEIANTKRFERDTSYQSFAFVSRRIHQKGKIFLFYSKKEALKQCYPFMIGSILCGLLFILVSACISRLIAASLVKPAIQTLRAEKTFISNASHELKTPLSILMANADLALRKYENDKYLRDIKEEGRRMNDLITQMLTLARLDSVEQFYDTRNFSVSEAFSEILCPFEVLAYEKKISLKSDIPEDLFYNGNEFQLKQLLSILLDNAISYTKPSGCIEVSVYKKGHLLFLKAANTGKELPEEVLKNMFERFYRSNDQSDSKDHFGLGLAIADEIVKKHKGSIDVHCADGKIIFSVQLPTG